VLCLKPSLRYSFRATETELKDIDKAARKKVDDEVAEAEKSPERM
jgi:TPP-dependent pyruvate/acetoin dehydrogenase alpha subunit